MGNGRQTWLAAELLLQAVWLVSAPWMEAPGQTPEAWDSRREHGQRDKTASNQVQLDGHARWGPEASRIPVQVINLLSPLL